MNAAMLCELVFFTVHFFHDCIFSDCCWSIIQLHAQDCVFQFVRRGAANSGVNVLIEASYVFMFTLVARVSYFVTLGYVASLWMLVVLQT